MSRHKFQVDKETDVIVGFDQPLQTFFTQVYVSTVREDDNPVLWAGYKPEELPEIEDLKEVLGNFVADLPVEIWTILEHEKQTAEPLTEHQKWILKMLKEDNG